MRWRRSADVHRKRDNLTQERRVNAFLLKKVILLKKLIRTNTLLSRSYGVMHIRRALQITSEFVNHKRARWNGIPARQSDVPSVQAARKCIRHKHVVTTPSRRPLDPGAGEGGFVGERGRLQHRNLRTPANVRKVWCAGDFSAKGFRHHWQSRSTGGIKACYSYNLR